MSRKNLQHIDIGNFMQPVLPTLLEAFFIFIYLREKRSASLNVTAHANLWGELGGNGNRFDTRGRLNK